MVGSNSRSLSIIPPAGRWIHSGRLSASAFTAPSSISASKAAIPIPARRTIVLHESPPGLECLYDSVHGRFPVHRHRDGRPKTIPGTPKRWGESSEIFSGTSSRGDCLLAKSGVPAVGPDGGGENQKGLQAGEGGVHRRPSADRSLDADRLQRMNHFRPQFV